MNSCLHPSGCLGVTVYSVCIANGVGRLLRLVSSAIGTAEVSRIMMGVSVMAYDESTILHAHVFCLADVRVVRCGC